MIHLRLRIIILSMILTLLIFEVLGGQSDANMFDNPFVNTRAASSQQVFDTPYSGADTVATLRRLRYLAGLRYFNSSTKKPRPSTLNNVLPLLRHGTVR